MKKRMTNLFASLFLVLAVGLALAPWVGISSDAKEEDQICDTYDYDDHFCHGHPTNCFCEIVVTP